MGLTPTEMATVQAATEGVPKMMCQGQVFAQQAFAGVFKHQGQALAQQAFAGVFKHQGQALAQQALAGVFKHPQMGPLIAVAAQAPWLADVEAHRPDDVADWRIPRPLEAWERMPALERLVTLVALVIMVALVQHSLATVLDPAVPFNPLAALNDAILGDLFLNVLVYFMGKQSR